MHEFILDKNVKQATGKRKRCEGEKNVTSEVAKCHRGNSVTKNRPFSKMAAEISSKSKLKTYTSTRKSAFTLVTLQSFSISGVISAEKM